MADREWYEIDADNAEYPNIEAATTTARTWASSKDGVIEIYQCTRTLVRTVQRNVTIQETDITAQP